MKCPVCNVDLLMTNRNSVEIDYCPQCRGVWLDRGELDKIIERSNAEHQGYESRTSVPPPAERRPTRDHDDAERRPHRDYDDDDDYRRSGGKSKRKSLLGELFDF